MGEISQSNTAVEEEEEDELSVLTKRLAKCLRHTEIFREAQNIYAKLEVHSSQELVEAIEADRDGRRGKGR